MVDFSRQENDLSIRNSAGFQLPACLKNAPYKMDPAKQEVDMQRRRIIASCHNTPQTVTLLSMERRKKFNFFIPVDSKFRRAHAARRICQNEMIRFRFCPDSNRSCNPNNQEKRISLRAIRI